MMKTTKTLKTITFLATIMVASMMTITVYAQTEDFELPDASTVPGNAFYGFERFIEDNFEVPWARLMQGQRGEALKRFLVEDGAGTEARFWKLAQSLSALYPAGSDEKRWVDGVLGRKKGLGL